MGSPCKKCGGTDRYESSGDCKRCHKVRRDARYQAKKSEYLESSKAWAQSNPDKVKAAALKIQLKRYGLTTEQYNLMLASQSGVCKICGGPMVPRGYVDHDHQSGQIRGLLCHTCNTGLGLLKDSPVLLARAIEYLNQTPVVDVKVPKRVYNEADPRFKYTGEIRDKVRELKEAGLSLSQIAKSAGISKSGVQLVLQE